MCTTGLGCTWKYAGLLIFNKIQYESTNIDLKKQVKLTSLVKHITFLVIRVCYMVSPSHFEWEPTIQLESNSL